MARDPQFVMRYMEELEQLAEDVLSDKQQIVDLDKKRNSNREALAALHKKTTAPASSQNKTWLNFGGVFLKLPKKSAITMLQSDQAELDKEISQIRDNLHNKVNKLRDAQGESDLLGYGLHPLSKAELNRVMH
nr:p53 and DNA damage-regulated protein 1-like [Ciona intestinalis]|eukprot:XP_002131860.1 p53 and DNA damage-regulated protein 1-like [Ciona intestinalis]